jgi:hypothetical protein
MSSMARRRNSSGVVVGAPSHTSRNVRSVGREPLDLENNRREAIIGSPDGHVRQAALAELEKVALPSALIDPCGSGL